MTAGGISIVCSALHMSVMGATKVGMHCIVRKACTLILNSSSEARNHDRQGQYSSETAVCPLKAATAKIIHT